MFTLLPADDQDRLVTKKELILSTYLFIMLKDELMWLKIKLNPNFVSRSKDSLKEFAPLQITVNQWLLDTIFFFNFGCFKSQSTHRWIRILGTHGLPIQLRLYATFNSPIGLGGHCGILHVTCKASFICRASCIFRSCLSASIIFTLQSIHINGYFQSYVGGRELIRLSLHYILIWWKYMFIQFLFLFSQDTTLFP